VPSSILTPLFLPTFSQTSLLSSLTYAGKTAGFLTKWLEPAPSFEPRTNSFFRFLVNQELEKKWGREETGVNFLFQKKRKEKKRNQGEVGERRGDKEGKGGEKETRERVEKGEEIRNDFIHLIKQRGRGRGREKEEERKRKGGERVIEREAERKKRGT